LFACNGLRSDLDRAHVHAVVVFHAIGFGQRLQLVVAGIQRCFAVHLGALHVQHVVRRLAFFQVRLEDFHQRVAHGDQLLGQAGERFGGGVDEEIAPQHRPLRSQSVFSRMLANISLIAVISIVLSCMRGPVGRPTVATGVMPAAYSIRRVLTCRSPAA